MTSKRSNRPRAVRALLLALAAGQAAVGLWALFAPRNWYATFPGGGRHWLPAYGPYNEHLSVDFGAAYCGMALMLATAAILLERRLVRVAVAVFLVYSLPHWIYHLGADDRLSSGDQLANGVLVGLTVAGPLAVLALSRGTSRTLPPG